MKLYNQLNEQSYRDLFHDKIRFLRRFAQYTQRKWFVLGEDEPDKLQALLDNNDKIVLKESHGDSGKQVSVYSVQPQDTAETIIQKMRAEYYNLAEEELKNHAALKALNETSLNTIRLVTLLKNHQVHFIFAGLRIGAKGAQIDNISQGGTVAKIDLQTGKICTSLYSKKSEKTNNSIEDLDVKDFQIPYWNEVLKLVRDAAREIPQIRFVAWDVGITPQGPALIEGNESFGSTIMQVFNDSTEEGIKPLVESILSQS